MPYSVCITGVAGFVGSHIADHIFQTTDLNIVGLDRLTYAGNLQRIEHLKGPRLRMVFHDFRQAFPAFLLRDIGNVRYVIHNGAETHVQTSLTEPERFIESNIVGTMNVLNACRSLGPEKVIYTSTDEVFGPAPAGMAFDEDGPVRPSNPYAATKASGETLCHAWFKSFGVQTIVTRTMNMFGEKQHPEKFFPLVLKKVLEGKMVPLHASRDGKMGSRCWIHARNQADAILFLLNNGVVGETYHVAGKEATNLQMAELIAGAANKVLLSETVDAETHRPGHDLRYALDDSKIHVLGWKPPVRFLDSIKKTVDWTIQNPEWLQMPEMSQSA
jgi:dTDP-glucose 4,6-dehydratase